MSAADLAAIRAAIERQARESSDDCTVHRPATLRFRDVLLLGEDVVQQVQITDGSGEVWLAYYAMQRQPDGTWRASGCRLVDPERTVSA